MSTITELLLERKASYKGSEKELVKFCKKVESTWHAPTKVEHVKRMAPFAKDAALVAYANTVFSTYFAEWNQFEPEDGYSGYDIKGAWYVFAFLLLAPTPQSSISLVINAFRASKNADLSIVRRLLHLSQAKLYQQELDAVEGNFAETNQASMAYRWLKSLGVEPPKTFDWELIFRLEAKPIEGQKFPSVDNLFLTVTVFEPRGDGESFEIELADRDREVSHDWPDEEGEKEVKCDQDYIELKSEIDLLHLKQFIQEIEGIYKLKFEREFHFSYFSKGFKNKGKVQKWMQE